MPLVELKNCELNANGFSQADKKHFLKLFEEYRCDLGRVCDIVGINPATYYNHLDADPTFALEVRMLKRELAWSLVPRQVERALANSPTDAIWLQKNLNQVEFNADRPSVVGGDRVIILQLNTQHGLRESSTTSEPLVVDKPRQPPCIPSSEQARRMQRQQVISRLTKKDQHRRQLLYQQKWRAKNPGYQRAWQARRKARLQEDEKHQSIVEQSPMSYNRQNVNLPDSPKVSDDKKLEQFHQESGHAIDKS